MAGQAAAFVIGGLAIAALAAAAGYAIAGSGQSSSTTPSKGGGGGKTTPPAKGGKWTKVPQMNAGGVPTYTIPAQATFAITMTDGTAPRVLLAGFNTAGGAFQTFEPGAQLPGDWPTDDQEGPLALRGEGAVPFALQIPAASGVLGVWQWTPAGEVGGGTPSGGALITHPLPLRHA